MNTSHWKHVVWRTWIIFIPNFIFKFACIIWSNLTEPLMNDLFLLLLRFPGIQGGTCCAQCSFHKIWEMKTRTSVIHLGTPSCLSCNQNICWRILTNYFEYTYVCLYNNLIWFLLYFPFHSVIVEYVYMSVLYLNAILIFMFWKFLFFSATL